MTRFQALLSLFIVAITTGCASNDNLWGTPDTHPDASGSTGDGGQGTGGSEAACEHGATICDGYSVQVCVDGEWVAGETCPYVCDNGACVGVCTPGDVNCDGDTSKECNELGEWQTKEICPFLCIEGGCEGACKPGTGQCNGTEVETCNTLGEWQPTQLCAFVCQSGTCTGSCTPNDVKCDGNQPQKCDSNGQWQPLGEACPFVCTQGQCTGSCEPGATQCNGNTVQACNGNGTWDNQETCPFVCEGASCAGVCVPGATKCTGKVPETCDANGQWKPGNACPFLCQDGQCTGVCVPGTKKCDGNGVQTCDSFGQWGNTVACPSDGGTASCSNGVCGIVCDAEHSNCNNNVADGCEVQIGNVNNCLGCGDTCNSAPNNAAPACTSNGCGFSCDALWGDCNNNADDGCEKDLSADQFNCGGCGISCWGGTCKNGTCEGGITKVTDATGVSSLTLATPYAKDELYWTDEDSVSKAPASGGSPVTLTMNESGPSAVVTDGANVIWSNTVVPKAIRSIPNGGGQAVDLVTGYGPKVLTHDGVHLFFTNMVNTEPCFCNDSSKTLIYRLGLGGGTPEVINPEITGTSNAYPSWPGVVVDATNVYRATWESSAAATSILWKDKDDTKLYGTIASNIIFNNQAQYCSAPKYLAITPNTNYLVFASTLSISGRAIVRVGINNANDPGMAVVSLTPSFTVTSLTADDQNVYAIGTMDGESWSRVFSYPLTGGSGVELAKFQYKAANINVDGTHLYWSVEGLKFDNISAAKAAPAILRRPKN